METTYTTEAAVIADITEEAVAPKLIHENDIPILVTTSRQKHTSLEHLNDHPLRCRASVYLTTLADHVAYIKAQRDHEDNTVLFAERERLRFHTLINYHAAQASWLDHSLTTTLTLSKQLQTWITKAGVWMPQEQFAEFLDENLNDITNPTPAAVLDFVECLQCTRKEAFRSAFNQTTGEVQFVWEKTNATDEKTSIVREFSLGIPVWHRGECVKIAARLHHRIKEQEGGKAGVNFRFKLEHIDRIQDTLWDEALTKLRTDLKAEATIYEGTAPTAPQPLAIG
jgi:uncharacterized protein YfdQ (DUF2303 family)